MNIVTMRKNETTKPGIDESADLGIGLLVLEAEDGTYQPVSPTSTIREARELAEHDLRFRSRELEKGGDPLCPALYRVWARNDRGEYEPIAQIEVG